MSTPPPAASSGSAGSPEPEIALPPFDVPESFRAVDPASFSVRVEAGVVHVSGELDVLTAPLLWGALEEAIAGGHGSVVIDLAETTFVDSMGLGVIVRAWKRLGEAQRPLSLRSLQPPVRKVFEVTGLDSALDTGPR